MIFYDIAITFGDEVEKIWKRRFTGATLLWLVVSFRPMWRGIGTYIYFEESLSTASWVHRRYSVYVRGIWRFIRCMR